MLALIFLLFLDRLITLLVICTACWFGCINRDWNADPKRDTA